MFASFLLMELSCWYPATSKFHVRGQLGKHLAKCIRVMTGRSFEREGLLKSPLQLAKRIRLIHCTETEGF